MNECVQKKEQFYTSAKALLHTKDLCNLWSFVLMTKENQQ